MTLTEAIFGGPQESTGALDPSHLLRRLSESASVTTAFTADVGSDIETVMVDAEIFDALQQVDFAGPAWDKFATKVAGYTLAVLTAWMSSGQIAREIKAKGIPVTLTEGELRTLSREASTRDEFADIAVATALHNFRVRGREGKGWHAEGGASLRTWILGASVIAFVNELKKARRWRDRDQKTLLAAAHAEEQRIDREAAADPLLDQTCRNELISEFLAQLPSQRDRNIVWGKAAGYSNAEIAQLFGERTARAVANRWTNLRAHHDWIQRLNCKES